VHAHNQPLKANHLSQGRVCNPFQTSFKASFARPPFPMYDATPLKPKGSLYNEGKLTLAMAGASRSPKLLMELMPDPVKVRPSDFLTKLRTGKVQPGYLTPRIFQVGIPVTIEPYVHVEPHNPAQITNVVCTSASYLYESIRKTKPFPIHHSPLIVLQHPHPTRSALDS
jgi:hypothetical protein